jgi:hypothetical protein
MKGGYRAHFPPRRGGFKRPIGGPVPVQKRKETAGRFEKFSLGHGDWGGWDGDE